MDQRKATLDELLSEPIILEMMARDRVRASDIRRLMRQAKVRRTYARNVVGAVQTASAVPWRPHWDRRTGHAD